MNGQYFNSSGSGNGTPTPPSNSSYPASLSSQSSRDPSPQSRDHGIPSQYGYSNYDQKSSPHLLGNNISNIPLDSSKQQPHGIYSQKMQPFLNSRSQQGLMNHNSPNIANYNVSPASPYANTGTKFNSSFNQPPLYSDMQNNVPNQMSNKSPFQSNQTFSPISKQNDLKPLGTSVDSLRVGNVNSQSQLPSTQLTNASQSFQNIPPSSLTNVNLTNSSPSLDQEKIQQIGSNNSNRSPLGYQTGSSDNLLTDLQTSQQPTSQAFNPSISPQSTSRLLNSPPTSSPLPLNPNIPPPSSSSSHSEQQSSSSDQSPALQPTIPTQSSQTVPSSTSNVSSSPLQNLFSSSQQGSSGRQSEIPTSNPNAVPPNQQPTLQNQTDSQRIAATVNHIDHVPAEEISGSGDDQLFKTVNNQDSVQAKPSPHSHQGAHSQSQSLPSLTTGIKPSAQFPPSTQTFGQYSTTQTQPSSLNSFNQPRPQSHQNLPPNVNKSNLGQYNNQYPVSSSGPLSATSVSQNVSGIPPYSNTNQIGPLPNLVGRQPPLPTSTGQQSIPPTSLGSHQNLPPTSIPPYQQIPPTSIGSYQQQKPPPTSLGQSQQMPPVSGFGSYQQMPPTGSVPRQQMPPVSGIGAHTMPQTGPGSRQQIPPPVSGFGSHQQIPPAGLGNQRQMPPPPPTSSFGSHQQMPPSIPGSNQLPPQQPPPINTPSRQYPQAPPPVSNITGSYPQNQFQQAPPLSNQYSQYQSPNAPIQTQPVSSGQPYGLGRYPPMPPTHGAPMMDGLTNQMRGASITQDGFNRLWGMDTYDLLKTRELLPKERLEAPQIRLNPELFDAPNCSPELFRCTLSKIPETKSLLDKSRLPFGVLIHPFKDLNQLSVVQCSTIVRCRSCRTYINPFVYFVDNKRWKCNLCFRVNELPDEFQFDPVSKTYGDPSRRPEVKFATIEFIAPSEYMVRPPQPAVYLFLFDVSRLGAESGYLEIACQTLLEELENLPGDARTSVGFITYDSSVHFYSLAEGLSQPHQMVVVDIDDMFLPCPDNLLVNLNECYDLIKDLLRQLPTQYSESYNTESALGAALQAAYKLLAPTGGRVTVFQSRLPSVGPGSLTPREDPSQRASDSVPHLNPITDFYKKLALDCSSQQIAVDLFIVNSQYVDIATLSGVSRFSGGCMYHFPLFRAVNNMQSDSLKRTFQRYLTRKIGFESVMRLRCTRGLSIHTFHGNFFVRSTDLLSLPNVNPDAGFGMQVSIDESLSELQNVCFQAALLYTSSNGERRIRVHTLCLPIATNLTDILNGADQQCIIGLLAKMAVDRSIESSLTDAREAFVNVVADILSAYKLTQNSGPSGCVLAASSLRLIPLYILALLKSVAFRTGQCTRLDDRVFAMCQMKSLPLSLLLQSIYPDIYPVHNLCRQPEISNGDDGQVTVSLQRLHLSSEKLDSHGIYLLDNGAMLLMYVGHNVSPVICQAIFGVPHFTALPQDMYELPELNTPESMKVRDLIFILQSEKPVPSCLQIIRDDSHHRGKFLEYLIEDKNEAGTSYYEFLQRIKVLMK